MRDLSQGEAVIAAERFVAERGYADVPESLDGVPSRVQLQRTAWGIRRNGPTWELVFRFVLPLPYRVYHLNADGDRELDPNYSGSNRGSIIVVMADGSKVFLHHLDGLLEAFTPLHDDGGS